MNAITLHSLLAFCFFYAAPQARPTVFSLDDDFSFDPVQLGPWRITAGGQPLPTVAAWAPHDYSGPQRAYAYAADGLGHTPSVLKVEATPNLALGPADFTIGQVVLHSPDPNINTLPGSSPLSIEWIAPSDGDILIGGEAWLGRNIGRTDNWNATLGGLFLAGGQFFDGDPWSSSNPFFFGSAFGVIPFQVQAGETLTFNFYSDLIGEYLRFNPIVTFNPIANSVPESLPNNFAFGSVCALMIALKGWARVRAVMCGRS